MRWKSGAVTGVFASKDAQKPAPAPAGEADELKEHPEEKGRLKPVTFQGLPPIAFFAVLTSFAKPLWLCLPDSIHHYENNSENPHRRRISRLFIL
jgi:hypothetical protein